MNFGSQQLTLHEPPTFNLGKGIASETEKDRPSKGQKLTRKIVIDPEECLKAVKRRAASAAESLPTLKKLQPKPQTQ